MLMNKLAYLVIITAFLSGFAAQHVHRVLGYIPEGLSGLVFLFVLMRISLYRVMALGTKYVLLGIFALAHIVAGLIINGVDPGTILFGMRPYMKWIPIILLPMAYRFSDEEIMGQLKLILYLSLIQFPVSFFQRFIEYRDAPTGDLITGTFGSNASGALSIFLISAVAVLMAFYMKRMLSLKKFIVMIVILFLPTTVNETKATILLLPLAVVIPYLYSVKRLSVSQLLGITTSTVALGIVFTVIFNYVVSSWGESSLQDFFSSGEVESYMYTGNEHDTNNVLDKNKIGSNFSLPERTINMREGGGRIDKLLLPIKTLSGQPIKLWVGLGIGNTTDSFARVFSGAYSSQLGVVNHATLLSFLLWETGVGGVVIFAVFMLFLLLDVRMLAKSDGIPSILASGWMGVLAIVVLTTTYTNLLYFNILIYVFTLISGYLIAEAEYSKSVIFSKSQHAVEL